MVHYKTVHYKTVHNKIVHYKKEHYKIVLCKIVQPYKMVKHYKTVQLKRYIVIKTVHLIKWYVTKRYSCKTESYKTVYRHYAMLHNSTLQSQSTGLHQPMNWLGVKPNLT
jgi:hypothetical protein